MQSLNTVNKKTLVFNYEYILCVSMILCASVVILREAVILFCETGVGLPQRHIGS